jgi:hypothetical protein
MPPPKRRSLTTSQLHGYRPPLERPPVRCRTTQLTEKGKRWRWLLAMSDDELLAYAGTLALCCPHGHWLCRYVRGQAGYFGVVGGLDDLARWTARDFIVDHDIRFSEDREIG